MKYNHFFNDLETLKIVLDTGATWRTFQPQAQKKPIQKKSYIFSQKEIFPHFAMTVDQPVK